MIRQEKGQRNKKVSPGKIIGLILVLALAETEFFSIVLTIALVLAPVGILLFLYLRQKKHRESHQSALENTTYTTCSREKAFDEQSRKLFCFHDDKAIHHVARGKEIDPWDRPDIDISKYQRKK